MENKNLIELKEEIERLYKRSIVQTLYYRPERTKGQKDLEKEMFENLKKIGNPIIYMNVTKGLWGDIKVSVGYSDFKWASRQHSILEKGFFETMNVEFDYAILSYAQREFGNNLKENIRNASYVFDEGSKKVKEFIEGKNALLADIQKAILIPMQVYTSLNDRKELREKAYMNRFNRIDKAKKELINLWEKENPVKIGDSIYYYNYCGGDVREGTIININAEEIYIKSSGNKTVKRKIKEICRTDQNSFRNSELGKFVKDLEDKWAECRKKEEC